MADAAILEVHPRRGRFGLRFGLRTFLIAVTLLGILLGWFGRELVGVRRQGNVVRQLLADGAKVYFDYQLDGDRVTMGPPPAPKILRLLFGDELFTDVIYVAWYSSPTSDKVVARLPELPKLKYVVLSGSKVTDQSIAYLRRLPLLEQLSLQEVGIQPDGIRQLSECPRLTNVVLWGSFVTDAHLQAIKFGDRLRKFQLVRTPNIGDEGVAALASLRQLESLDIYFAPKVTKLGIAPPVDLQNLKSLEILGTGLSDGALPDIGKRTKLEHLRLDGQPITAAGVTTLAGLRNLRHLLLANTQVSDDGLAAIRNFSELEQLDARETRVGDKALSCLAELSKLERLNLMDTQVTDEGLLQLKNMKSLRYLCVSLGQGVSREGALQLQKFLPECTVDCWAPGPQGAGGGVWMQGTE